MKDFLNNWCNAHFHSLLLDNNTKESFVHIPLPYLAVVQPHVVRSSLHSVSQTNQTSHFLALFAPSRLAEKLGVLPNFDFTSSSFFLKLSGEGGTM